MATGIAGRLMTRATKDPLARYPVKIVNSTGAVVATVTTDNQGIFAASGLGAGTYFAVPSVSGDDWDLQVSLNDLYGPTIVTPSIAGATLTSPTIVTPTIASLVNATHNHSNADGGGATLTSPTLVTPTVADFTNATHQHNGASGGGATLTSPTIVTPTIASLVNATHNHSNAAGGGSALTPASAVATGAISSSSPTAGIGYATGAGGTVTQITSKATGVTLNTICGTITMQGAALAADTTVAFTLTDSAIAASDVVVVVHDSVGTIGAYSFGVTPGAGSAVISVHNNTPGILSEAIVLRFAVIKAVVA